MSALLAVLDDLIQFVWVQFSGAVSAPVMGRSSTAERSTSDTAVHAASSAIAEVPVHPVTTFQTGEVYFIGKSKTVLYLDPVITFDNASCNIPYGQKVRVQELRGRWAAISYDDHSGWVIKDALVARLVDVYPQLQTDHFYGANDPETIKLRACIDDIFAGSVGAYPLNAAEYVYYRLSQQKRTIDWGTVRFRIAGTWQRKLRGAPGVHLGVQPRTNAVMEYVIDDVGYLSFVDAVYADGSLKVSEVGTAEEGLYTERELSSAVWKELRPVFISVV